MLNYFFKTIVLSVFIPLCTTFTKLLYHYFSWKPLHQMQFELGCTLCLNTCKEYKLMGLVSDMFPLWSSGFRCLPEVHRTFLLSFLSFLSLLWLALLFLFSLSLSLSLCSLTHCQSMHTHHVVCSTAYVCVVDPCSHTFIWQANWPMKSNSTKPHSQQMHQSTK